MFSKKIALAVVLAASVYAQDESSSTLTSSSPLPSASLSPCLLGCLTASTECTFTDPTCVCVNVAYQQAVAACLTSQCTPDDLAQAQALQASICGDTSSSDVSSSTSIDVSSSLSSRLSSVVSSVSSRVSSVSSRLSTATSPSNTSTATGGSGGAAGGVTFSLLATGGAVLLGVIGGGLLVF